MTAKQSKTSTTEETPEVEPLEDLGVILPDGGKIVIEGIDCRVRRLKSREFFALMRILTQGLGNGLSRVSLSTDDPDQLEADLVALFMVAVPLAIEETAYFLNAIVEPEDPRKTNEVSKIMENPEIDVTLDTLGVMIEQEKDDLQSVLFPKAQAWLARLSKAENPPPTT